MVEGEVDGRGLSLDLGRRGRERLGQRAQNGFVWRGGELGGPPSLVLDFDGRVIGGLPFARGLFWLGLGAAVVLALLGLFASGLRLTVPARRGDERDAQGEGGQKLEPEIHDGTFSIDEDVPAAKAFVWVSGGIGAWGGF